MLINTTKEINGTKYSFDKKGVGEVWKKFKITLDKDLPSTYEYKDDETGKMYTACQLIGFDYDVKENYATKNNDVTIHLTSKLLYTSWKSGRDSQGFRISLVDANGTPARIEPIHALIGTFDTFDSLTGGFEFDSEGDIDTENYKFRDIKDGNYTLVFKWGYID
ncbi:MAG: hypothetical protein J6M39_03855 [Lachnospiraceae bacterium]|nr:hypothetical protein [Lachnospiraceae bacterium]